MSTLSHLLHQSWPVLATFPVLVCTFVFNLLLLLNYVTAPRYTALEPPPLPHLLPYIGHALSFVRDQRAFFEWANKKTGGKPFSILLAGDKLHIFLSPSAAAQIFRKSSTLHETRTDQQNFWVNILGFLPSDAKKIAELRDTERKIHAAHLLTMGPLEGLLGRYLNELDGIFDGVEKRIREVKGDCGAGGMIKKVGLEFIGDTVMHATVQALFGHDSFAEYADLFKDFRQFLSEHFFERLIGMPDFFARGAVRARERIKMHLKEVVAGIVEGRVDVSGYNGGRVRKLGEMGLCGEGVISNEFDIILGSNLNSIPVAYLCLLHLLHDPKLLTTIRAELASANLYNSTRAAAFLSNSNPPVLPRLRALFHEVLRYHTTSWSAREVATTTTITISDTDADTGARSNTVNDKTTTAPPPRTYTLEPPSILALPSSLLHHNPAIHSDPQIFDAERFLAKEYGGKGTPVTAGTLRPFGGGTGLCPGRRFAEGQVLGLLGSLVERFDIILEDKDKRKSREEGNWRVLGTLATWWGRDREEIPRNADFFYATKQKTVGIFVGKR